MKQSTLHLPRNIPHQFPLCNIYKARYYAGYETERGDVIRWSRDDNLKSFPTEGPHLVFDTDRPESAGGDVLESFRSSMTLDFLRQRFALTRIQPSLPHQFLLFPPSFFSIHGECPSPLLLQPGHVYVGVTGGEDEYGVAGRGWKTVGQALSEIPSYG